MTTICDDLRKAVLQAAIQGKLTQHLPEDGNAEDLYQKIQKEKQRLIKEGKIKKEKPLPEIAEDDIPFDIPENWKWVYLGDVFSHNTGKALNQSNTEGTLFSYITTSNLYWDGFVHDNLRSMKFTESEMDKCTIKKGDLLVCEGGDIGRSAIWPYDYEMRIQNHIHKLRAYVDVCTKYYWYVLYLYKLSELIGGKGIGIQGLSSNALHKLIIPLPPLAEQKRIVACVDNLMKKIDDMERTEKDITALYNSFPGDMKASLLQAAIQGKLTEQLASDGDAETLYQDIQKEKQRLIKEGKIKKEKPLPEIAEDDIPFDIPENWKWVRLGAIGSLIRGSGIKKDETTKGGKPCVRYGEIYTSYWLQFYNAKTCTSEDVFSKCKQIEYGDLIFTLTGENKPDIAKTIAYLGNGDVAVGGDLAIWTNHYCNPKYLSYFMYSDFAIGQKVEVATGDIIVHISCDKVSKFLLPLPPFAEQKRIVEKLDQLLPLCDAMSKDIAGGEAV